MGTETTVRLSLVRLMLSTGLRWVISRPTEISATVHIILGVLGAARGAVARVGVVILGDYDSGHSLVSVPCVICYWLAVALVGIIAVAPGYLDGGEFEAVSRADGADDRSEDYLAVVAGTDVASVEAECYRQGVVMYALDVDACDLE